MSIEILGCIYYIIVVVRGASSVHLMCVYGASIVSLLQLEVRMVCIYHAFMFLLVNLKNASKGASTVT